MHIVLTGIRVLWTLFGLGIPSSGMSCSGSSDSKPAGGGYTHMPWGSVTASFSWVVFCGLWAHSSCLGGVQLPLEHLKAWWGVQSPPQGLGMPVAGHPQVLTSWHPGCLPLWSASYWLCTFKGLWQHCTWHDMALQTNEYNFVELWPGPGFSPFTFSRCL